jgi:Carboxypeptidase regulatory-like domain
MDHLQVGQAFLPVRGVKTHRKMGHHLQHPRPVGYFRKLLLIAGILTLLASAAAAQGPQLRTVHGIVMDKSESAVASAIVFLKNTRTNAVRSYISDDEGNYRFSGLDPNVDYEIYAEKDGLKSATRTVSSFDSKKDIVINLKLDRKK